MHYCLSAGTGGCSAYRERPTMSRQGPGHVDFVVEVADVADDGVVLHLGHVLGHDDVFVAGGGDEDVGVGYALVEGDDLVAVHAGLEGTDGIDLGDE
eukprot:scaffold387188_cov48-Prasinocladus_malaysianus.AAC.1